MLKSMTGFGAAEAERDGFKVAVELRSVNHRFLDIALRLPRPLLVLEDGIKARVRERVDRGRISLSIEFESKEQLEDVQVNASLVQAYVAAGERIVREMGLPAGTLKDPDHLGPLLATLLAQPEVLARTARAVDTDAVRDIVLQCVDRAVDQADEMKLREGRALGADLQNRLDSIVASHRTVEMLAPGVVQEAKQNLKARLAKLLDGGEVDAQRLAQEVAFLADRSDINEECVRLASHLQQFSDCMRAKGQGARRMGFLLQEMHREVNTIGSKTAQLEITHEVLRMKEEIEKLREQVQNLE